MQKWNVDRRITIPERELLFPNAATLWNSQGYFEGIWITFKEVVSSIAKERRKCIERKEIQAIMSFKFMDESYFCSRSVLFKLFFEVHFSCSGRARVHWKRSLLAAQLLENVQNMNVTKQSQQLNYQDDHEKNKCKDTTHQIFTIAFFT